MRAGNGRTAGRQISIIVVSRGISSGGAFPQCQWKSSNCGTRKAHPASCVPTLIDAALPRRQLKVFLLQTRDARSSPSRL